MAKESPVNGTRDSPKSHLTTRRGFVTVLGFSVVSLYGLWAAYGAAPTSLAFMSGAEGGGMQGMGHGGEGGMSPEEFNRLADAFFEANELPDGSVRPARRKVAGVSAEAREHDAAMPGMSMPEEDEHGDEHEAREHDAAMPGMSMSEEDEHGDEPVIVYVRASRYGYEPDVLRLEPSIPYKFRIMAVDADHGASINFRMGSRIIRCRARVLTEAVLMFTAPGEYLSYCTIYCGEGHDQMMAKIVVA